MTKKIIVEKGGADLSEGIKELSALTIRGDRNGGIMYFTKSWEENIAFARRPLPELVEEPVVVTDEQLFWIDGILSELHLDGRVYQVLEIPYYN